MMDSALGELGTIISRWASTQREIGEVWIFGSRARGDHKPNSDLDVALVMRDCARPKSERYGDWLALGDKWATELQAKLNVELDLEIGDADIAVNVVGPAVRREGIRIY